MYVLCIKHSQFAVRSSQYSVVKDYKDSPASLSSQGIFLSFYPHFLVYNHSPPVFVFVMTGSFFLPMAGC